MPYSKETHELLNRGYRYALSLTSNADDAFDLVQSAYLKILEKNKPLVIPYLIATIRNQFIDQLRKSKLHEQWGATLQNHEPLESGNSVEPVLEKYLALLPARSREILFLSVVEEFTAQEISDLLEIPRGTVLFYFKSHQGKIENGSKRKINPGPMKNIDELVKKHYNSQELTLDQFDSIIKPKGSFFGVGVWKYAAVFVFIIAAIVIFRFTEERRQYQIIFEYAQEVALNHEKQLQSDILSNDISDLGEEMDKLDFKVVLPDALAPGYTLNGGRYCSIKTSIAAQLKLENALGTVSTLYVFRKTDDFDIDKK